jgi:hypothetical protein
MIGRGEDKIKRFNLGIMAMKYIIKEIPNSELKIISSLKKNSKLKDLVNYILKMQVYIFFLLYSNLLD